MTSINDKGWHLSSFTTVAVRSKACTYKMLTTLEQTQVFLAGRQLIVHAFPDGHYKPGMMEKNYKKLGKPSNRHQQRQ